MAWRGVLRVPARDLPRTGWKGKLLAILLVHRAEQSRVHRANRVGHMVLSCSGQKRANVPLGSRERGRGTSPRLAPLRLGLRAGALQRYSDAGAGPAACCQPCEGTGSGGTGAVESSDAGRGGETGGQGQYCSRQCGALAAHVSPSACSQRQHFATAPHVQPR